MIVPLPKLELIAAGATESLPGPVLQRWAENGRPFASGGRDPDGWWMHWNGLATFWFGETGDVRGKPARDGLDTVVRDIFARGVVPTVMVARGFEALHASAVVGVSGVSLLCGKSGTGKSSLAFAMAGGDLEHFADDAVVFTSRPDRPEAVCLPFPVRVDADTRRALNRLSTPLASRPSAPFHAIYLLERDNEVDPANPDFVAIPSSKGFARLLPFAHLFEMGSPDRRRGLIETMLAVARQVPVWECRFAPDLKALPALAAAVRRHLGLG